VTYQPEYIPPEPFTELKKLWEKPFDVATLANNHENAYRFHEAAGAWDHNPAKGYDKYASKLIVRAILAEVDDKEPPEPKDCGCCMEQ
jgi:hypothetical protein